MVISQFFITLIFYVFCYRYAKEGTEEDLIKIGKTPIIVIDLIGKLLRNLIDKLVKKPIIVIDSLVRYLGVFFSILEAWSCRGPHNMINPGE